MDSGRENFQLKHTQIIHNLCQTGRAERNEEWVKTFLAHMPTASMAARDPQVTAGPDGFPYFNLYLPPEGEGFEPFSLAHILEHACVHGFGIAVFVSDSENPDWVFSFGDLWNYQESGEFYQDPPRWGPLGKQAGESISLTAGESVLVAQPNNEYFPVYVRKTIAGVLSTTFHIPEPKVFLLTEDSLSPSTNLVFNVFREDFEDEALFDYVKTFIAWSLPRDYGLVEIPKDSELCDNFAVLVG